MPLPESLVIGQAGHKDWHSEMHIKANAMSKHSSGVVMFEGVKGKYKVGQSGIVDDGEGGTIEFPDVTITDDDFPSPPPDGTVATTLDLSSGLFADWIKQDGVWLVRQTANATPQSQSGGLIAAKYWIPPTTTTLTSVGATPVVMRDANATHLSVTFTVPQSGAVAIMLEGVRDISVTNIRQYWGLRWQDASGLIVNIPNSTKWVGIGSTSSRVVYHHVITGLTPGSVRTIRWAHGAEVGGDSRLYLGGDSTNSGHGTAVMEVLDASGVISIDLEALPTGGATVPATPTGLVAIASGSTQTSLTWDTAAGVTTWDLQRSPDNSTWASITSASTNSYADSGLAPSTAYWYRIRAENSIGNSAYTTSVTATTLASGGGSTGAWRGLADSSWFNTPLPDTGTLNVASVANSGVSDTVILDHLATTNSPGYPEIVGISSTATSRVVYWADAKSPSYNITARISGTPKQPEATTVRIPAGATTGPLGGSMTIIDRDANKIYDLQEAIFATSTSTWSVARDTDFAVYYLDSNGFDGRILPTSYPAPNSSNYGSRGIPLTLWPFRWDEYQAGAINHALRMTVGSTRDQNKTTYASPATNGFVFPMQAGESGGSTLNEAPPQGTRLRIKSDIDLATKGLSAAGLILAKGLQTYGAVITQRSSTKSQLLVENLAVEGSLRPPGAPSNWTGIITANALSGLPFRNTDGTYNWEVAKLGWGSTYSNQNG